MRLSGLSSSSESESGAGVAERDAGADFAGGRGGCTGEGLRGRGVPHISHSRRRGLFRKVQATQAISSVAGGAEVSGIGGDGVGELDRLSFPRFTEDDGRDFESEYEPDAVDLAGMVIGAFMEARGTPQSAQTMAAADVRPIGLRLLHTSHSQNST